MKKLRACIIDDEPIACRKVQRLLNEDREIELVGLCTNGEDALETIRKLLPDLIFLDIQMPVMDGFELLESLDVEKMPYVIFVTAYDEYAIRAFEVHALDYLLKPFDKKRFLEALRHAKSQIGRAAHFDKNNFEMLLKEAAIRPRFLDRLVIKTDGKIILLKTELIDWIEARGKYEFVHAGEQSHLIREGMNHLEARLDPMKFVRIHKSTIVNVDKIHHLEPLFHSGFRLTLRNGTKLTISRRYRAKLEHLLGKSL